MHEFNALVHKIADPGDAWQIIQTFKRKFGQPNGSSSLSWAVGDLDNAMRNASDNAATFIASFWDGCDEVKADWPTIGLPDVAFVNSILIRHDIPFELRPPDLLPRTNNLPIAVAEKVESLPEKTRALIRKSLEQAEQLLSEHRPRQAVQEVIWILETVSTGFQGKESGTGSIEGRYFYTIIRDLRRHNPGTVLKEVLGWVVSLHEFLYSPTGGGVRHGTSLAQGGYANDRSSSPVL